MNKACLGSFDYSQDKRISRNYGRSFRGMRVEVVRPDANWGPRISAIPIASTEGLLDVGIYRGNVNSDVLLDFVHDYLAPNVNPFHGINPPSFYLPPYSPDFMPCEGIISQLKGWI